MDELAHLGLRALDAYPSGQYECDLVIHNREGKLHLVVNPHNTFGYRMTFKDLSGIWVNLAELLDDEIFDQGIPTFDFVIFALTLSKNSAIQKRQRNPRPIDYTLVAGEWTWTDV